MIRSAAVLVSAAAVSGALVLAYAALGGGSYEPDRHRRSVRARAWRAPDGLQEAIEQIALSTADGAACELGVTREDLVLALASDSDLDRFAAENDISREDAETAIRDGLVRAVDDAEGAKAISAGTARLLRGIATRLPIGLVLAVVRGASGLLPS